MEPKKTKRANLENKRGLFLEIGLVVVMGIILMSFEHKSRPKLENTLGEENASDFEQEMIPITRPPEDTPPPPPPPPSPIDMIDIVDDDMEIEDEFDPSMFDENNFELTELTYAEEEKEDVPFQFVEDMPSFKGGGLEAFRDFIQSKVVYPTQAQEMGIQGRVTVSFVVNREGKVEQVKVLRGVDPSIDEVVIKAVQQSPTWTPGKQRGKAVKVLFSMPINFVLN